MKITGAYVSDPTLRGVLDFPQLCVVVDQLPDVSIAPQNFAGGWVVGKYGPFVKYTCGDEEVDAGDFNVQFRTRFPMVVDITLVLPVEYNTLTYSEYSLPLKRARQLIRKHCPEWRLLLNEHAAERGAFLWLPVESHPSCRVQVANKPCGKKPARPIKVGDVDVAMCQRHVEDHNSRHAERRTAQAS